MNVQSILFARQVNSVSSNSSESSRQADYTWICSCGQENVGDFCVACGKPKNSVAGASAETSSNEDSGRRRRSSQPSFSEPQQQPQPEPQPQPQSQVQPQPQPPTAIPATSSGSNIGVIAGAIAGVLLLAGGGFFAWQHFQNKDTVVDEFALNDNSPAVTTENNSSDNTTVIGNYYVVNCQTSVTLRRTPSTTSVELAQVPLGQAVGFIEEGNAEFSKVNYNGTIGYILTQYLSAQKPAPVQNQPTQNQPVQNPPTSNTGATLNLGGVQLGDSLEKVRQVFGKEDRVTGSPPETKIEYRDIVVYYNGRNVTGLVSYSPAVKTERNIHEGSSLNEVIATYGRRCSVQNYEGSMLYEYPYENQQGGLSVMRFAIKNGVVDYISLRTVSDAAEKSKILSTVKTI